MKNETVYIGVDVDDQAFHGYAIREGAREGTAFKCRPNAGHLSKKLEEFKGEHVSVKICYEATYLGYSLQRDLAARGWECEVIAPSLIPIVPGQKVKTDKIDSKKLAIYYMKGELTVVHIPSVREESVRDLIRTRHFLVDQLKGLKAHVLSMFRRMGYSYREGERSKRSHWTPAHIEWMERRVAEMPERHQQMSMYMLLEQIQKVTELVRLYEEEIENLGKGAAYEGKVKALRCYRGIDTLTAMTLISELGDIRRFDHPGRVVSYAGFDLKEYSSGGREIRMGISKMGNRHIRTSSIEACQQAYKAPRVSKQLRERREGVEQRFVDIADRCMNRLYKKSCRMHMNGKHRNKIKTACAREMLCFVWETLRAA